jgi:hypothetical protein
MAHVTKIHEKTWEEMQGGMGAILNYKEISQKTTNAFVTTCNKLSFATNSSHLWNYFAHLTILTTILQLHL